jgi:polyhydroxybutyrate depolymerase
MMLLGLSLMMACENNPVLAQTIEHDGERREYIVYVPESYDGASAVPLLFNFHGFGGEASDQMSWADFRPLADEHGFIVVYPQGTELEGYTHWNSALPGGDNKSTADDLGFVTALIDQLSASHNIDAERVYASGYSNGGFMSYALACHHSDRFAAIAPVSATMLGADNSDCVPSRPVPVISLNGTADSVVQYDGGTEGYQSVSDVLDYWVSVNNTSPVPTSESATDSGTTIERIRFDGGDNGSAVEHYKVIGGEHVWFSLRYQGADTEQLIWSFLSAHDLTGLRQ